MFNKSGRQLKVSFGLNYGSTKIPSGKEYCYLGITFSLSGSLTKAQDELRKKGLRAYFSLKNTVDVRNLSIKGGGGGVHPDYFVKLDFEIAVDQQTRARDRTFEGVPDSG